MRAPGPRSREAAKERYDAIETVRRALREFLALPILLVAGFLFLAAGVYAVDRGRVSWLEPTRAVLEARVFGDARATADLLGTIAAGVITVTSITFSLLLLALQQVAASLTAEVYDQFLRRRHNQAFFGFFVGLALYSLVTLATVNDDFNPVIGATLAFLLTVIALNLLVLLLYTTINQMRPAEVIDEIQRHTLAARVRQLDLIARTRRTARLHGPPIQRAAAEKGGYVTRIDLDLIAARARDVGGDVEVNLLVSVGSYVAYRDPIAEVRAEPPDRAEALVQPIRDAVRLERQQDLAADPSDGIEQLEMMAWTSISTAKSDPSPALLAIRSLRDVLARWSAEDRIEPKEPVAPVVYHDTVFARLMDAFESLAVVASESMQHQSIAEVLRSFTLTFDRLPPEHQARAEDIALRMLSTLGDHVLTAPLERELRALEETLRSAGRETTASALAQGRAALALSIGRANSRGTRLDADRRGS